MFIDLLLLPALSLTCCVGLFSSGGSRGYSLAAVHGLPIGVASLVAEPGLENA